MVKVWNLNTLAKFSGKQGPLNIPDELNTVKQDLLKTNRYELVLVCLESGQTIPPHPESDGACFYVIDGKGTFTVGSEQFDLARGEMIFAPANEIRGILSKEKLTVLGIHDTH